MGLEKVKDRVLAEAKRKAASSVDSAKTEAANLTKSFSKQAAEKEAAFKEKLHGEVEMIKKKERAGIKLETKKLNLTFRKEFADEIFLEVHTKLKHLPESKRKAHIDKLMEKAKAEIDVDVIYCNKNDLHLIQNHTVKEMELLGGIIAESANGTLRVDYSYDTLLEQLKRSLLPDLNKMLFEKK